MNRIASTIALMFVFTAAAQAHDAWLAAKWNNDKSRILISALVAEHFPNGNPIKGMQRYVDPRAYVLGGKPIALTGDPSDSTLLGSLSPAPSIVVATGVKQRETTFKRDLAVRYLMEEIGLTKEEASPYLTAGVQEFQRTYSRYLKTIVATGGHLSPRDTTLGLPLEIVLMTWEEGGNSRATIKFRLLHEGAAAANKTVRVLLHGTTTIIRTDTNGEAQTTVAVGYPILLSHIHLTKLAENRWNSLWTNLAIYRLNK